MNLVNRHFPMVPIQMKSPSVSHAFRTNNAAVNTRSIKLALLSVSLLSFLAVPRFLRTEREQTTETLLSTADRHSREDQASFSLPSGKRRLTEDERTSLVRKGDLYEAMQVFEQLRVDEGSDFEWIELSHRLAHSMPEQGLLWLVKIPSTEATRKARSAFGNALWAKDPAAALSLLDQVIKAGVKPDDYRGYASALLDGESKRSFQESLNLLERLIKLGGDQSSYLIGLGASLQSSGEYSKVLMFSKKFPHQIDPIFLGDALYQTWKSNPTAAQESIDQIPDPIRVGDACNVMACKFVEENPTEAKQWIESMPRGVVRDRATFGLARGLSNTDPLEAARWAFTIEDSRSRAVAADVLLGPAIRLDRGKTEEIVRASSITPAEITRWLEWCEKKYLVWKPKTSSP
jgi:hypothetical protein